METKNDRIARLISYLDALGIKNVDIEGNYDSRLIVQKVAFIMDTLVGELRISDFQFRIKGPYSHELTTEYFKHEGAFNSKPTHVLDNKEMVQIEKIRDVMANSLDAESLEVVASLLYLKEKTGLGYEDAEIKLKELKPYLSEEVIWHGSNLLKSLLLTEDKRTAYLKAIAKEMEPLDIASNEDMEKFL